MANKRRKLLNKKQSIVSQIYAKNSFGRFGDDLCEVLLSYLSFEDRFRCECLSKQCQRLVFTTLTTIKFDTKINYKKFDKSFDLIVKKCTNITKIELTDNKVVLKNSMFD